MADLPFPRALVGWPVGSVYRGQPLTLASGPSDPHMPIVPPAPTSDDLLTDPDAAPDTKRSPESVIPETDPRPVVPVTEEPPPTRRRTRRDGPLPSRACVTCFRVFQPATAKQAACDRKCGAIARSARAKAAKLVAATTTTTEATDTTGT